MSDVQQPPAAQPLPPFTLLLPVYAGDRPDYLERAFRSSTADQTVPPAEVVLVQDGPVGPELAATIATLAADPALPVRLVVLERNTGLAAALTRGLAEARHDLVARMDADDISLPHRFATQLPRVVEGELDLLGSGMFEFESEAGTLLRKRIPLTGSEAIAAYARFHSPFNHPTVILRKSAVEAAGGYIAIGRMEDYWLWARMIAAGARVDNVDVPLLMYRVSDGAYRRRGGLGQLRSEIALQRAFRGIGFTSRQQATRNLLIRTVYRLVPERVRKVAYRLLIARGGRDAPLAESKEGDL